MKNTIKTLFFALLISSISSCENDKEPIATANGFELRKDASVIPPTVITDAINTTVFSKLNWDKSDNGVSSVATYKLVVFDHDNDPKLENPIEYNGTTGVVVTPDSRTAELTAKEFNDLINQLPTFKCSQMNIDIRIKSTLGTVTTVSNPFIQYSSPITYTVTGYSTKKQEMCFAKDDATEFVNNKIVSSAYNTNTDLEGYMYLQPGNYKFFQPDACGDYTAATVYGGASGALSTTASSITITTAGHYLVKANLTANTYSVSQFTTFGVFGLATRPTLSGNQVPMTYDEPTKTWKLTVDLRKGYKFKFKSNLWTGALVVPALPNPPYAPGTATSYVSILGKTAVSGELVENTVSTSGEISVPGSVDDTTRQKYDIELNVSNPRNYTYKMTAVN